MGTKVSSLSIACLNVNGLMGRLEDVLHAINVYNIDILFVCETRLRSQHSQLHECVLVSSPWPYNNVPGRNAYGVAFFVHPRWVAHKHQFIIIDTPDPGLTLKVRFCGIDICGVYMPPHSSSTDCTTLLEGMLPQTQCSHTVVLGDFNMRCGAITGDRIVNARGSFMPQWLEDQGLRHQPSPLRIATHRQGPKAWSIVDYVWVSADIEHCCSAVEVRSEDDVGGTDHHIVQVSLTLTPVQCKPQTARLCLRLKRLENMDMCTLYARHVQQELDTLERPPLGSQLSQ